MESSPQNAQRIAGDAVATWNRWPHDPNRGIGTGFPWAPGATALTGTGVVHSNNLGVICRCWVPRHFGQGRATCVVQSTAAALEGELYEVLEADRDHAFQSRSRA